MTQGAHVVFPDLADILSGLSFAQGFVSSADGGLVFFFRHTVPPTLVSKSLACRHRGATSSRRRG